MSNYKNTEQLNCPCDLQIHPPVLNIPAGLSHLPRQQATFPEFRNAMLAAIRTKYALNLWNARKEDDYGVMLLEMWAYVCDALTLYDQVIAQEIYLRTAQERASLSKLIYLIGYLPRPAVAATVHLAAIAEGRRPVLLPKGLAFRSGAFDGEAPQVFELMSGMSIHPFTNKWRIKPVSRADVLKDYPSEFYILPKETIEPGMILFLLQTNSITKSQGLVVDEIQTTPGIDQKIYTLVRFDSATRIEKGTSLTQLQIYLPKQTASLWAEEKTNATSGKTLYTSLTSQSSGSILTLDKVYSQIKPGTCILVSKSGEYRAFKIKAVNHRVMREPNPVSVATINGFQYDIPSISIPVTEISLDADLNDASRKSSVKSTGDWTEEHLSELLLHFDMHPAGDLMNWPETALSSSDDPMIFEERLDDSLDTENLRRFLLEDVNQQGAEIEGQLKIQKNGLAPKQSQQWPVPLKMPVWAYGNTLPASRGETVNAESLGFGDATLSNQRFQLKKKPLTYLLAPATERGVANTLEIYVNGIRWKEIPNFFLATNQDQVYIVREDEEAYSYVTFGDGIRGERLPTGSQVVAYYRFGAGLKSPPAGSISQIATPVEGLQSIRNPISAFGGADPETTSELRTYAPASALVLGRAVSIPDMEATALSIPGVQKVRAEWRWDGLKQRPLIAIWYIGASEIESQISERLRRLSDPNTPFHVKQATAISVHLSVSIQLNSRYIGQTVLEEVQEILSNKTTGILAPENQNIGLPFYRSKLFEAILSVPGTESITAVFWNNRLFHRFAKRPKAGCYFDFEKLSLTPNKSDL